MLVRVTVGIIMIMILQISCSNDGSIGKEKPKQALLRILFVGNSFTNYNGGINKQLECMAASTETAMVAVGGFNLQNHWNSVDTLKRIRSGKWDYVILQEQSQLPIFNQDMFFQYVKLLDQEIKKTGAKTILLMTWERPDSVPYGVTTKNLAKAYGEVGRQTGATIAPAGTAFSLSLKTRPDIELYSHDGHPTPQGSYLAACVLYGAILRHNPVEISYTGGIKPEVRKHLQQIAAESLGY